MLARILNRIAPTEILTEEPSTYTLLLENLPHIIFELDVEFCWTTLNSKWERVTGFPSQNCIGISYREFIHPEDRKQLHGYFQGLHRQGDKNVAIEARILTSDGASIWTEVSAVQVANPQGYPVCIGTITDITDRITEEELLHANNRSLSGLLNDLSGMVYRCRNDQHWTMEYISGGCMELTGYTPSDMINNAKLSWSSLIHPEDRGLVWAEVQSGVREARSFEIIYRIKSVNNQLKWVWERGKGIFSDDGELLGLEGVITDITTHKLQRDKMLKDQLYDPRTMLPKQQLFQDRFIRAIGRLQAVPKQRVSLLIIQFQRLLDAFERFGEEFELQAVLEIATRLQSVVTDSDSITCITPDRYAILIDRIHSEATLHTLSDQLLEAYRAPIQATGKTLFITCSIGGADSSCDNLSAEKMMHNALVAADHAGAQGGSRFEYYDPDITDHYRRDQMQ